MQVKIMQPAQEVDDYNNVTVDFKDTIYYHKLSGTGNVHAPYQLNKEALKNLKFINFSTETELDADIRTFSNLAWQQDLGINICFLVQEAIVPGIKFDKMFLN